MHYFPEMEALGQWSTLNFPMALYVVESQELQPPDDEGDERLEPLTYTVTCLMHAQSTVKWPSWSGNVMEWDDEGRQLRLVEIPPTFTEHCRYVSQGRGLGLYWQYQSTAIHRTTPESWEDFGQVWSYDDFDPIVAAPWAIDDRAGRLLHPNGNCIDVYDTTTETRPIPRIASIDVGGQPLDLFLADEERAYVVLNWGLMVLIDFVNLQILGVYRIENVDYEAMKTRWGYDHVFKRILRFDQTPDTEEGVSTCIVRGWFPQPLPVAISPSIPLAVPREGVKTPLLVNVYGDAGEPIAGATVEYYVVGDETDVVRPQSKMADANGNAIAFLDANEGELRVDNEAGYTVPGV